MQNVSQESTRTVKETNMSKSMRVVISAGDVIYGNTNWWYCRAILLGKVRNVVSALAESLDTIDSYSLGITPVDLDSRTSPEVLAQWVSEANDLVSGIIPGIPELVLGIRTSFTVRTTTPRREVNVQLCPEVLRYGWAINALIMGYLRGKCWPDFDDKTHQFDLNDLHQRLELWWKNDWVTNPEVTWYLGEGMEIEAAAFGSVFNISRRHPDYTYVGKWIGVGPIADFCNNLIDNGLAGDASNPSYDDEDE